VSESLILDADRSPPAFSGEALALRVAAVPRAELITLEDLEMEPVAWIWDGWIARDTIHLIAGVPEAGKTSTALKLCATVSSGGDWPDGTKAKAGSVLIWTGEDSPAQTITPRLIQM
jgi:RecA-family ATPase